MKKFREIVQDNLSQKRDSPNGEKFVQIEKGRLPTSNSTGFPANRNSFYEADEVAEILKQYKVVEEEEAPPKYFVDTNWFNLIIGAMIMLNTLCIGLDVDYGPKTNVIKERLTWYILENIFGITFVVEMLCKQYFYRWGYFKTNVNRLDFALVLMTIVDTWVLSLLEMEGGMRKLTMIRTVRMVRLVRLVRLVTMFKELWLVCSGLMQSLKMIMWVSIILIMVVYVLAIVATMQIGQNDDYILYHKISGGWNHRMYFGSVSKSMLTLFQVVTLDKWCDTIARHVVTNNKIFLLFFVFVIFVTSFGLLNLVVGIIVENTLSGAKNNAKKIAKKQYEQRCQHLNALREIIEIADADHSGTIEFGEFQAVIQSPAVANRLKLIDMVADDAVDLFQILDIESRGVLTSEEFITGCLKLKGPAKSKDLLAVQISVESMAQRMEHLNRCIHKEESIMTKLDVLTSQMSRHYSSVLKEKNQLQGPNTTTRHLVPGTYMPNFPPFL